MGGIGIFFLLLIFDIYFFIDSTLLLYVLINITLIKTYHQFYQLKWLFNILIIYIISSSALAVKNYTDGNKHLQANYFIIGFGEDF